MSETPKVTPVKSGASESNIFAALSYLSVLSVIFYVIKKDDAYVQFHAKQGIIIFAFQVVGMLLGPLSLIIGLVAFVLMVIGGYKAYTGEKYRMPVVADLADKIKF